MTGIDDVIASAEPERGIGDNSGTGAHLAHCFRDEYPDTCKYGEDETCPARPLDPFAAIQIDINDLRDEARLWLDGAAIENEAQATDVATLIDKLSKAGKAAEAAREAEKKPHLDAGRAVDAKFKPLIKSADTAIEVAKGLSRNWLLKKQADQRAEAARLAKVAAEEAASALAASKAATASGDLDAREQADLSLDTAADLIRDARRAEKARASVKGDGATRALGLRSVWVPTMVDRNLAIRHYLAIPERCAEVEEFILSLARKDVRAGSRVIAGFDIKETQIL